MEEITRKCGENAGKIWRTLNSHGALTKHQIIHKTNLSEEEFHAAVGWLARENKIRKDGDFYTLSTTNLTWKIGTDAGRIYNILANLKNDPTRITEVISMEKNDVYAALGWLAREGKIREVTQDIKVKQPQQEKEEELKQLREEINDLQTELDTRNQIIHELTQQLTNTWMQCIQQADIIERFHLLGSRDYLSEIQILQEEVESRNKIIHELTQQLTKTQTQHLEHIVTSRLRNSFMKNLSHLQLIEETDLKVNQVDEELTKSILQDTPSLHLQREVIQEETTFQPFDEPLNLKKPSSTLTENNE
ncbi:MAG TPA: hypothetical protein ENG62_01040 [Thermoplasmatales archaeon]|nr:hypothetical protein [Thermoplasmatales archaeon]